jgi:hypothetical protein
VVSSSFTSRDVGELSTPCTELPSSATSEPAYATAVAVAVS